MQRGTISVLTDDEVLLSERFIFGIKMSKLDNIIRNWHLKISQSAVVLLYGMIAIVTFIQIFFRYVINYSLPWADELARYCFVWLVYCGIVISLNRGEHAVVSILTDKLRGIRRQLALILVDVLILILFICLTIGSIKFLQIAVGQSSSALRIPKNFVYIALPFCGIIIIYEIIIKWLYKLLRKTEDGS